MTASAGIVCHKTGFGCTIVDGGTVVDHDIDVPASIKSRGEALTWVADETKRLVESNKVRQVRMQQPGGGKFGGASSERTEVEAAVQIGIHRGKADCDSLTRDQVRAALGVPKEKGAYKLLLTRPDVEARSNGVRRDQYLLALAASE